MKNRKKIIILSVIALAVIVAVFCVVTTNKKEYTVEVSLIDSKDNPSRKLVIKNGNKEITDAKEIKTENGISIDKTYPFTINHTSVKKIKNYIIVVLKNGKEVKAKIINKGE